MLWSEENVWVEMQNQVMTFPIKKRTITELFIDVKLLWLRQLSNWKNPCFSTPYQVWSAKLTKLLFIAKQKCNESDSWKVSNLHYLKEIQIQIRAARYIKNGEHINEGSREVGKSLALKKQK